MARRIGTRTAVAAPSSGIELPAGARPAAAQPPPATSAAMVAPQQTLTKLRHDPAGIRRLFGSGEYPYTSRMRMAPHEAHMLELQRELLKAQRWVESTGQRIVLLFEGRDAAGAAERDAALPGGTAL